jgi:DNA-binding beta-propeller fold protein YncE
MLKSCCVASSDRCYCSPLSLTYSFASSLTRIIASFLLLSYSVSASIDYLAGSAGSGLKDVVDGVGQDASFSGPSGIAMVADNQALITDWSGHAIRSVDFSNASALNVTTIAGTSYAGYQDGVSLFAAFNNPSAIAVSSNGEFAYISDFNNLAVRELRLRNLTVTTLLNNSILAKSSQSSRIRGPRGLAVHPLENSLFINDVTIIYKLNLQSGVMERFAGSLTDGAFLDGFGTRAFFAGLMAMAMDPDGSRLLVTDVLVQVLPCGVSCSSPLNTGGARDALGN